jgi:hypothetical protein
MNNKENLKRKALEERLRKNIFGNNYYILNDSIYEQQRD